MTEAFLGIGSNLGDRERYIKGAIELLGAAEGVNVARISKLYETDPVGGPPQGRFLNGAVKIETSLSCRELLNKLMEIEALMGRERGIKNGPRTIDLDILTFGDMRIDEEDLVVPHPGMNERDFVKRPLADIL
jgi:2-amino-4-hydroxy-6-hydroxymethyldihydropteridine diphosphokinase